MSREYIVSGDNQTLVAAPILVQINPAASPSPVLELIRAWASQRANATSAQQGIALGTKATAFATVVSATPAKTKQGDPASAIAGGTGAAGTAGINASANGAGAEVIQYPDNFNVLNGWLWVPTPAETLLVRGGDSVAHMLKMLSTPGTLTAWSFGAVYREVG